MFKNLTREELETRLHDALNTSYTLATQIVDQAPILRVELGTYACIDIWVCNGQFMVTHTSGVSSECRETAGYCNSNGAGMLCQADVEALREHVLSCVRWSTVTHGSILALLRDIAITASDMWEAQVARENCGPAEIDGPDRAEDPRAEDQRTA